MFNFSKIWQSPRKLKEAEIKLKELQKQIESATYFVKKIEEGQITTAYPGLNESDVSSDSLPGSLISMRNKLLQLNEEESQRKWSREGLTFFNEILRKYQQDLEETCNQIISNLIKYIQANQGTIYIVNQNEKLIEQYACYAYNRKKYLEKSIEFGEGLIGQAYLEKQTIVLHEIPENYIQITSGLGDALPNSIVIVPLKTNEEVQGIIEIASFKKFEKHQIKFLEKLGESIASIISSIKVNEQTKQLLVESEKQADYLKLQEGELRENMKELSSTQEALVRKQKESSNILEKFNLITKTTKEGLWDMVVPDNMDINGNTPFFWTNRFRNMLGYRDETDFPNVLHAWSDLLHPEDKENTLNAFNRHLVDTTGNTPYDVEYKLKLKNGTYKWFRAIGNTVRDYAGKPLRIAGSLIDIQNIKDMQLLQTELENKISERTAVINKLLTESKEQNEELSSQEEELRQNLEEIQATQELLEVKNRELAKSAAESLSISNGINEVMCSIVFSPEGNIISANKNFLNTMGYTLEQIKDKHHRIFVPNEIVESDDYKSFWTRLAEGEAISEIFKRINANGEIVWLNAVYTPIFDDNGIVFKIIKFATNVTDQQKVASEAKSIFKGIDKVMSVIEFTPEGIVNNANKNFLEIMKYKFDDIQGKHHQMFVPKNLRESSDYQSFWKRLSEGEAISEIFNRINADGESVWLNAVYSPIINSEGQVVKVIKLATDISYEKEKEAQVLALLEEAQSQEEELLQNMEELEAIQEDIQQQALEMSSRMNAINESGISSIEFDLQGNILTANSNFLKLMGYALKEIQGKHHSIFVDEDYKNSNAYQEFWEALRQGKAQMGEQKRMKKDGNPVFLYGSYSLIKDILGKPKSVIKLAVDISSIKK